MFRIYFQNGDFLGDGIDCLKDIWIPLAITFIGFSIPLLIQWKWDRRKERKFDHNQIDYFDKILESILKQAKDQSIKIKEHAEAIKATPFNWKKIHLITGNDADRLAVNPNHESFKAFISINGDSDETIKRFKEIYSCIDQFYYCKQELKSINLNSRKNNYKSLLLYKEHLENLTDAISSEIRVIEFSRVGVDGQADLREFLNSVLLSYHTQIETNPAFPNIHEQIIMPTIRELVGRFRNIFFNEQLLVSLKKLKLLYFEIIQDSKDASEDFLELDGEMNEAIQKLEPLI